MGASINGNVYLNDLISSNCGYCFAEMFKECHGEFNIHMNNFKNVIIDDHNFE